MSLIREYVVTTRKNNRLYKKRQSSCECDMCNVKFVTQKKIKSGNYTFCSKKCRYDSKRKSSDIGKEISNNIKKGQAKRRLNPELSKEWRNKISRSLKLANKDGLLAKKRMKTYFQNHGEEHHEMMKRVFREKHGVDHPSKLSSVKQKLSKALKNRHSKNEIIDAVESKYCVNNVMKLPEIIIKVRKTVNEKYGVKCVLELPWVKKRSKTIEAHLKRHITMKKNGSYARSKPEDFFYSILIEAFGIEDVKRQVKFCNKFCADFFVVSCDVFIQVDGLYWHGLDRQIEQILESKSKHKHNIMLTMKNDSEQNEYIKNNGLSLLRVSDKIIMKNIRNDPNKFFEKVVTWIKDLSQNKGLDVEY